MGSQDRLWFASETWGHLELFACDGSQAIGCKRSAHSALGQKTEANVVEWGLRGGVLGGNS